MNGIPALAKLRQHRHDPVEQGLGFDVLLGGHGAADFQNVLYRSALQRRSARNFEIPSAIAIRRLAVAFSNVQGNRLGRSKKLVFRVAVALQLLSVAVGPADVLDGAR